MKWSESHSRCIVVLLVLCLAFPVGAVAASIEDNTRVALQTTLRSYISGKTINGHYTFFHENTGDVEVLSLKKVHPVIFEKNGRFLMCADFIGQDGQNVLIDYIVVPGNDAFLVEKEVRGQRPMLTTIFERIF